jgi:hypothetical protein
VIATTLWLRAFALTVAIETSIAVPLLGWPYPRVLWTSEIWAFGFEIIAYKVIFSRATWRHCVTVSVAANLGSFLFGFVADAWGWLR